MIAFCRPATHDYQVELLTSEEQFAALREEWDLLHQAAVPYNPFLSYDWTSACWKHACRGTRLHLLTARDGGRLVGVAPLRLRREVGFRVLRFIGNGWSDYTGFLRAPGHPEVEGVLVQGLARTGGWDLAYLRQLSETFTGLLGLELPFAVRGRRSPATVAPYLTLGEDWSALCKFGPPSLRRAIRADRKWNKEGGTTERHGDSGAAGYMDEVVAIEAASWKARSGAPAFQGGPGKRLIEEALSALGARGEMELWLARMHGRPAAYQLNVLTPDRLWYYRGAYDEEFRRYFPGGLLHYQAMRRAWETGRREYDFLTGGDDYKLNWTNRQRSQEYLVLFPAAPLGYLAYLCVIAPRWSLRNFGPARAALKSWVRWHTRPRPVAPVRPA